MFDGRTLNFAFKDRLKSISGRNFTSISLESNQPRKQAGRVTEDVLKPLSQAWWSFVCQLDSGPQLKEDALSYDYCSLILRTEHNFFTYQAISPTLDIRITLTSPLIWQLQSYSTLASYVAQNLAEAITDHTCGKYIQNKSFQRRRRIDLYDRIRIAVSIQIHSWYHTNGQKDDMAGA